MIAVYGLSFFLAGCALMYELLIARAVSLWAVNNAVWYALAVGIFIGGMGLGAALSGRGQKGRPAWQRLWRVECWVAVAGGLSVFLIHAAALASLFCGLAGQELLAKVIFFGAAFAVALAVGIGAGVELPLLLTMVDEQPIGGSVDKTARVLLMDYAGALLAGLIFPFFILPVMDVMTAAFLVAGLNAVAALWLLRHFRSIEGRKRLTALLLLFSMLLFFAPQIEGYFISKYYFSFQDKTLSVDFFKPRKYTGHVERLRSPYQVIDLVTADDIGAEARGLAAAFIKPAAADNKKLEGSVLFLNHDFQFAVSYERIYHEAFAHVPVSVLGRVPQRVLILGAGDGLLLREILKYSQVKSVILVDIDPKVVEIFKFNPDLSRLNDHSLLDPRVQIITGDAYQYVRHTREKFDMVFCDFPNPDDYDLAKLYSREFYTFARQTLLSDGMLVLDAPGISREMEGDKKGAGVSWKIFSSTLHAAGFGNVRPFFSSLEEDNRAALTVLDGDAEALKGYLEALSAGFIMASPQLRSLEPMPLDVPGLRVMTDERVRLGLSGQERFSEAVDIEDVNSLFHPLFPLREEWSRIRTAY
ncbi:MAG: hypothetical protein HQL22_05275 [Candidatus Omnitrophica bacterium]|nr:hypothetical protein [Candidatus Omnitrophota bacterium]